MDQITCLWKLCEIENALEKEKKIYKSIIKSKEIDDKIQEHNSIKNIYEMINEKLEEKKSVLRKFEHEGKEIGYKREEIKGKLYDGKTNDLKQLQMLLKEEEKLDNETSIMDGKILEIMEEVEKMEAALEEMNLKEKKMGGMIKKMLKERKKNKISIENKILELKKEKEEILKMIDKKNIEIYRDVQSRKNKPIAMIKSDICMGCHMDLPIMTLTKLKKDEIVTCNNCGRILYNKEEKVLQ